MNKMKEENSQNQQIRSDLKSSVIHFLSYKPRTSFEIRSFAQRYLKKINFPVEEQGSLIEDILFSLKEFRYIDDLDYAQSYILEQQQRPSPRGPKYVYQFLSRKGIPQDIIRVSLETHFPEEKERLCIEKILAKRKGSPDKMIQYLLRKGFTFGLVYALVDTTGENH